MVGEEGRYNRRVSIVQMLAKIGINSHSRQKGAHGENQEPGLSQKYVPELRPPEQGTALAGQSLMTQPAGDSPPAPAESGQGIRTMQAESGGYRFVFAEPSDVVGGPQSRCHGR